MRPRAAIILAAGQGVRMRSALPKPLHAVGGRAMAGWAIALARDAGCEQIVFVVPKTGDELRAYADKAVGAGAWVVQDPPLGTGHAVRAAETALAGFDGDVIVLAADSPLIRKETIERAFAARAAGADIVILGFEAADPTGYGRLIETSDGAIAGIVEDRDCDESQRAIRLCNSSVMAGDARTLFALLAQVKNDNAKNEYYLTDVARLAHGAGKRVIAMRAGEAEVMGVNSRSELAEAEAAFQARARAGAMEAGVTLIDPSTVYFSYDTAIEPDVVVEPNVFFGLGVRIERGAVIHAFCHFEQAHIGPGAEVGPFARLRPGAQLGAKSKIGNFVEVKNSTIGEGTKASHLTYLGDATVGAHANIGAGTITCNYDGFDKYRTVIGDEAFVGSHSALVAPVSIGARVYTAAGSVITTDVPEGDLGIARGRQANKRGWADDFRARKTAEKAAKPK
jgi:bifunctional UDP-N-acetylglucosamine pyrophosphorylase/glucosamine-1-phosphate N-acetyltransferase